jgi:hypothetical protein
MAFWHGRILTAIFSQPWHRGDDQRGLRRQWIGRIIRRFGPAPRADRPRAGPARFLQMKQGSGRRKAGGLCGRRGRAVLPGQCSRASCGSPSSPATVVPFHMEASILEQGLGSHADSQAVQPVGWRWARPSTRRTTEAAIEAKRLEVERPCSHSSVARQRCSPNPQPPIRNP